MFIMSRVQSPLFRFMPEGAQVWVADKDSGLHRQENLDLAELLRVREGTTWNM